MIITDHTTLAALQSAIESTGVADLRVSRWGPNRYAATVTLKDGTHFTAVHATGLVDALEQAFSRAAKESKPSTIPAPDAEEDGAA